MSFPFSNCPRIMRFASECGANKWQIGKKSLLAEHDMIIYHENAEIQYSHQAKAQGVAKDKGAVGAAASPVVRHEEKREGIEEHDQEGKQAEPHIELSDMLPQVGIGVYGSVLDACTHTDENQQKQGYKQQCIHLGTT